MTQKIPKINNSIKETVAKEFEEAVKDVLVSKTKLALENIR